MTALLQRRQILAGRLKDACRAPRPLGALSSETAFRTACSQCGVCAAVCPNDIIRRDRDGFPVVDVLAGGCNFCGACAEACPTAALSGDRTWPWQASVTGLCLGQSGITCRACEDSCDSTALRFKLMIGGRSTVGIDADRCTGCGNCILACPVSALELTPLAGASLPVLDPRMTESPTEAVPLPPAKEPIP